ncbi:MAG: 16S rRNA (adenine(1518)-N(6)/adenine(1519)-N(6))-dimethyltransferase RsmA [Chloroflexi bacterium]|nr:16S rRNA (adenine(1518)-N(6)/adenine(1519)-N(6))-dimethyltransferase RsmA [Chloroflexota bacterium]
MTGSSGSGSVRPDPLTELDAIHLGPEQVERYLRRHGLRANKRLSQNHLVDGAVLESIIEASGAGPDRPVLEVGPGIGILTAALLQAGARVTAVEVDPRLYLHLQKRFAGFDALRLVEGDILDTPMEGLVTASWDLVANLPYHVTSPVLHQMLDDEPRPVRFTLMVQREVAERIASPPGGLSYLSVFVQYHADVRIVRIVPGSSFEPAPAVESAVLAGVTRPRRLPRESEDDLWRLVLAGFGERRKMIHNVLVRQLPMVGRERIEAALAATGITPDRRPQTLSVDDWLAMSAALGPIDSRKR